MPTGDLPPPATFGTTTLLITETFPEILTPEEASRYLRVTRTTLTKAVKQKDFPILRVAGSWRVSKSTLDAYLRGEFHQEELGLSLRSKKNIIKRGGTQ